jgi:hypothetical protein
VSKNGPNQGYSPDEVRAVISRALTHHTGSELASHGELRSIAEELGIDAATLDEAAAAVMAEQKLHEVTARKRRQGIREFYVHLGTYLVVNAFLVVLNLVFGGYFWALFPILGWSVGLAAHLLLALLAQQPSEKQRRKALRKAQEAHQLRIGTEAALAPKRVRLDAGSSEEEATIEQAEEEASAAMRESR